MTTFKEERPGQQRSFVRDDFDVQVWRQAMIPAIAIAVERAACGEWDKERTRTFLRERGVRGWGADLRREDKTTGTGG